jgi:hypothetical protein
MVEVAWNERVLCECCPVWARWRDDAGRVWCNLHRDPARRSDGPVDGYEPPVEATLFVWQEEQR